MHAQLGCRAKTQQSHIPTPTAYRATAGWGNGEAQCYTRDRKNVRAVKQAGGISGVLVIEAHFSKLGFPCTANTSSAVDAIAAAGGAGGAKTAPASFSDAPATRYWSSGRITTRNKAAFMWSNASSAVKVEAMIKFPQGRTTGRVCQLCARSVCALPQARVAHWGALLGHRATAVLLPPFLPVFQCVCER